MHGHDRHREDKARQRIKHLICISNVPQFDPRPSIFAEFLSGCPQPFKCNFHIQNRVNYLAANITFGSYMPSKKLILQHYPEPV
jgi:hypothetical protein